MERLHELQPEFVRFIPETLQHGILYISREYDTAIHLCACGCGEQTVTPINKPYGWQLTEVGTEVSLTPSIGNFSFDCKSHYYIKHNKIIWL